MRTLRAMRIATLIGCLGVVMMWGCTMNTLVSSAEDDPSGNPSDQSEGNLQGISGGEGEAGECRATDIPFTGLADGDVWFLASRFFDLEGDPLLLGLGSGEQVSALFVGADLLSGGGCAGAGSDVDFTIDGSTIELRADLSSFDDDQSCTFELSGVIDPCGHDVLGLTVFDVIGDATARIGGEEFVFGGLEIIRLTLPEPEPCEEPVESFADRLWVISNDGSGAGGFPLPFPVTTGPSVSLSGFGEQVQSVNMFNGFLDFDSFDEESLGCFGFAPEGEFSFDGETLSIDITSENDDGGPPCSIVFTGTVVSCTLPGGGLLDFGFESDSRMLRVEGAGRFLGGGVEGELDVLLVTVFEPFGGIEGEAPCEETPVSLEGTDWQLSIDNPFSFNPFPDFSEAFISIAGDGEELGLSSIFVGDFNDEDQASCTEFAPEGSVRFDGETFSIDVMMTGFISDFDEAEPCSITFSGRVASCTVFDDPFGSDDIPGMTVIELDGEGEYVTVAGTGPITTMYLTLSEFLSEDDGG